MFSTLDITYARQRLENATRRAERAAQHTGGPTARWFGRGSRAAGALRPDASTPPTCC
jgi:hypothetical protein